MTSHQNVDPSPAPKDYAYAEAVSSSRHVLLVLTPNWIEDKWNQFEGLLVRGEDPSGSDLRTLPVLREYCKIPNHISILYHADFTEERDHEEELTKLLKTIEIARHRPNSKLPTQSTPQRRSSISGLWTCYKCQAINPPQTKCCFECGTELMRLCPECKSETSLVATKMCGKCGYSYEQALRREELRRQVTELRQRLFSLEEEYTEVYQKANGFPPLNVVLKTELFIGAFLYVSILFRELIFVLILITTPIVCYWVIKTIYTYRKATRKLPHLSQTVALLRKQLQQLETDYDSIYQIVAERQHAP